MRRTPVRSLRRGAGPAAAPAPAQRRSSSAVAVLVRHRRDERSCSGRSDAARRVGTRGPRARGHRRPRRRRPARRRQHAVVAPPGAARARRRAHDAFPPTLGLAEPRVRRRGGPRGAAGARPAPRPWPPACPPGTRAMAIPVEPGTAPPLVVGDRVDVLVALRAGGGRRRPARASRSPPTCSWSTSATRPSRSRSPTDAAPRLAVAFGAGGRHPRADVGGVSGRRRARSTPTPDGRPGRSRTA